ERGLADSGIARHDHDPGRAASYLEPRVVQLGKRLLAPDQRLRLEPPLVALRHHEGLLGPRPVLRRTSRPATLPQEVRHTHQLSAGLRTEHLPQSLLEAGTRLQRIGAVPDPATLLH